MRLNKEIDYDTAEFPELWDSFKSAKLLLKEEQNTMTWLKHLAMMIANDSAHSEGRIQEASAFTRLVWEMFIRSSEPQFKEWVEFTNRVTDMNNNFNRWEDKVTWNIISDIDGPDSEAFTNLSANRLTANFKRKVDKYTFDLTISKAAEISSQTKNINDATV